MNVTYSAIFEAIAVTAANPTARREAVQSTQPGRAEHERRGRGHEHPVEEVVRVVPPVDRVVQAQGVADDVDEERRREQQVSARPSIALPLYWGRSGLDTACTSSAMSATLTATSRERIARRPMLSMRRRAGGPDVAAAAALDGYPAAMSATITPGRDIVTWDELDRLVAGLAERLAGEALRSAARDHARRPRPGRDARLPPADPEHPRGRRRVLRRPRAARPAPDVPPVPGRPAPARPAHPRRRRGLGQRDDDPRGDRADPPGRWHPDDRCAALQAKRTRSCRASRTSTR